MRLKEKGFSQNEINLNFTVGLGCLEWLIQWRWWKRCFDDVVAKHEDIVKSAESIEVQLLKEIFEETRWKKNNNAALKNFV